MVRLLQGLFVASLTHAVCAYSKSVPLLAWSSFSAELLPAHSTFTHADALFDRWIYNDDVCKFDGLILVNQPGLHASDLRTLSSTSALPKLIDAAPSSAQLPYVQLSTAHSRDRIVEDVSRRCGSRILDGVGANGLHKEEIKGSKFIVALHVPALARYLGNRKSQMAAAGNHLAVELEGLISAFPNHLVIYSDWGHSSHPSPNLVRRQDPSQPTGGILKRYQLLSPGLILSLLLTFFVILPIILVGIQALSSIQSPVRLDGKMLAEYRQKKNQ